MVGPNAILSSLLNVPDLNLEIRNDCEDFSSDFIFTALQTARYEPEWREGFPATKFEQSIRNLMFRPTMKPLNMSFGFIKASCIKANLVLHVQSIRCG